MSQDKEVRGHMGVTFGEEQNQTPVPGIILKTSHQANSVPEEAKSGNFNNLEVDRAYLLNQRFE